MDSENIHPYYYLWYNFVKVSITQQHVKNKNKSTENRKQVD